jgi:methionyl-tRNA formyltransferase
MQMLFLGRGHIARRCLRHCNPVITLMNDAGVRHEDAWLLGAITHYGLDTLMSIQYQWILSPEILAAVGGRAYNLHNAKLPDYRGHHGLHWALENGDRVHISTIHQMAASVDTGPIICEAETSIWPEDTAGKLYWRSVETCERLFVHFLELLRQGGLPLQEQEPGGAYYSKRLPIPEGARHVALDYPE